MYRFRTTFEMDQGQIRQYLKTYAKTIDLCVMIFFCLLGIGWLALTISVMALWLDWAHGLLFLILSAICFVIQYIFRLLHLEYLMKHPPFAIGGYITMEMQDGFFHVNCAGRMKSYSRGDLIKLKTKTSDYILYKRKRNLFVRKEMIVIPAAVLTELMALELDRFVGVLPKQPE